MTPRHQRPRRLTGPAVGLLGGSFNPAHDGHRYISLLALQRLRLDQVWWLVSPQNPLKPRIEMAPFAERFAGAEAMARDRRIVVSDFEQRIGSTYTADTLDRLTRRFPRHRFVWLMGADCLVEIHRWRRWHDIFRTMPIAVFDRPTYSLRAMAGKAASTYAAQRRGEGLIGRLPGEAPPAWAFVRKMRLHHASASAIRRQGR